MKKPDFASIKKEYIIIAVIIGIILMLVGKMSSADKKDSSSTSTGILSEGLNWNDDSETYDYLEYLAEKTRKCLENTRGVGKAEVLITPAQTQSSYMGSKTAAIQGVLIVAQGADNPETVSEILESCEALFGISVHKIKVVRMKEGN